MALTQRVLIDVEADTSDAVDNFKKLDKAVGDASKGMVASLKETFSSLGALDGQFQQLKRGLGEVFGAVGKFSSALRGFAADEKLHAQSAAFNIGSIQKSLKGLRSETEIMTQVSQLSRGEQKLSQSQMETLTTAIAGFEKKGLDAGKSLDIVRQAVVQLSTDGLKEMGIHVDKTGISMDTQKGRGELLNRVINSLTASSKEFAAAQMTAGDEAVKAANKMEDAIARLERSARKGAAKGAAFVEGLGTDYARSITGGAGDIADRFDPRATRQAIGTDWSLEAKRLRYEGEQLRINAEREKLFGAGSAFLGSFTGMANPLEGAFDRNGSNWTVGGEAKGAAVTAAQALMRFATASTQTGGAGLGGGGLGMAANGNLNSDLLSDDITNRFFQEESSRRYAGQDALKEVSDAKRKTFMEQTFGPLEQFDAYKTAWDGFTGAVTAGYGAMVDGTMSFGKAFKQAVAGALKATGAQMLIESLKEAAYGTASLFTPGGQVAAVGHFKASGMFLAGSIAAGVAASQLGGSGAASAGGGGGGGAGGAAPRPRNDNAGPRGGNTNTVMIIGDPHDTETNSRRRTANAKRIVKKVSGDSGGGSF